MEFSWTNINKSHKKKIYQQCFGQPKMQGSNCPFPPCSPATIDDAITAHQSPC